MPNLLLVAVVLVTSILGFFPGVIWAFVAGLTANLLVPEPLGSLPLSMLAVAAAVAGGGRLFGRLTWLYPILAAIIASMLADVINLLIFRLVADPIRTDVPISLILPAALLNGAIAALIMLPVRFIGMRQVVDERPAW